MKKLLVILMLGVLSLGSSIAETPSKNQLQGWWVLMNKPNSTPSIQIISSNSQIISIPASSTKRKMYFSEDNHFFSAQFFKNAISRSNGGKYYLFSDSIVTTFHQDNYGELFGMANTYHIEMKGDSMHFYGFFISTTTAFPTSRNLSSTLQTSWIDEWWVRESPQVVDENNKAHTASINWVKKQAATSPNKKFLASRPNFLRDSAVCYIYISNFNEIYSQSAVGQVALKVNNTAFTIPPRNMNENRKTLSEVVVGYSPEIETKSTSDISQSNGRIEFTVHLTKPEIFELIIGSMPLTFYLEPGKALGIVLDSKDLFMFRGINNSKRVQFYGPLAAKNQEM